MRKTRQLGTLAHHLDSLRERAGLSLEALAKEAGYRGASSVQRYLDDPQLEVLQVSIARKFARALHGKGKPAISVVDLAPLIGAKLDGEDAVTIRTVCQMLDLPNVEKGIPSGEVEEAYGTAYPIMGSSHASHWLKGRPSIDEPEGWLTIPLQGKRLPGQYVLKILGTSINRVANEGHFAVCQRFGAGQQNSPEGKFVHIQRERLGEMEWSIKKAKWTANGLMFYPDSSDAEHQDPIAGGEGEDIVSILGIVVGWYKPA